MGTNVVVSCMMEWGEGTRRERRRSIIFTQYCCCMHGIEEKAKLVE